MWAWHPQKFCGALRARHHFRDPLIIILHPPLFSSPNMNWNPSMEAGNLAQQIGVTVKNHGLTLPYQIFSRNPTISTIIYFKNPVSRGRPVYSMLALFFQELQFSHCSPFQDPNSIAMTIDMHLTLPPGFIEYTRRVSSCKLSTSGWGGPVYSMLTPKFSGI